VKWFLYKLFFNYPAVFSFFYYYRQKKWREDIEGKAAILFNQKNPGKIKKIVQGIAELKGVRKIQKYLIPHMDEQYIKQYVDIKGIHHLEQAIKEKKGVVLMAAHLGNPHLSFNALRAMGYNITTLKGGESVRGSKHSKYKYYDREENTIFVHEPSPLITYKKRILDTLESEGIIYHPADAAEGRSGEEVTCLGVKMRFPTGMIYFAHRAESKIIPFFHFYKKGKITLIFREPINNNWIHGKMEYNAIITKYAKILEYYLLKYPEQYLGAYGPTVLSYYYQSHYKEK